MYKKKYIVIYGIHPIIAALKSKYNIYSIYYSKNINNKNIIKLAKKKNINIKKVNIIRYKNKTQHCIYAKLYGFKILSLSEMIKNIIKKYKSIKIIILKNLTDIKNIGAIIRTSYCSGIYGIIIISKSNKLINGDLIKSSVGAIFFIYICIESSILFSIKKLKSNSCQIISTSINKNYKNCVLWKNIKFNNSFALIFGNEHNGISNYVLSNSDYIVNIPTNNRIRSLNVSVSCGIILYEYVRQNVFKLK